MYRFRMPEHKLVRFHKEQQLSRFQHGIDTEVMFIYVCDGDDMADTDGIDRFTIQLLNSLVLLRKHKLIHCDLKPEVYIQSITLNATMY